MKKFPANEITWDNYWWAVRKVGRWVTLEWNLRLMQVCREVREDVKAGLI